jgi:hypothetical protein
MESILFILTALTMDMRFVVNIHILNDYIKKLSTRYTVHVACISGQDDFDVFEDILPFTYKVISTKMQLDKLCDFVSGCPPYDWYVKIRPEVQLLEQLDFDSYSKEGINARARVYTGPLSVKHASSAGGQGYLDYVHAIHYSPELEEIILDDQVYIFHRTVVEKGGFAPITDEERGHRDWYITSPGKQHEWFHTGVWISRKIPLNLIGIHMDFTYGHKQALSANVNVPACAHNASKCPARRIY